MLLRIFYFRLLFLVEQPAFASDSKLPHARIMIFSEEIVPYFGTSRVAKNHQISSTCYYKELKIGVCKV